MTETEKRIMDFLDNLLDKAIYECEFHRKASSFSDYRCYQGKFKATSNIRHEIKEIINDGK